MTASYFVPPPPEFVRQWRYEPLTPALVRAIGLRQRAINQLASKTASARRAGALVGLMGWPDGVAGWVVIWPAPLFSGDTYTPKGPGLYVDLTDETLVELYRLSAYAMKHDTVAFITSRGDWYDIGPAKKGKAPWPPRS